MFAVTWALLAGSELPGTLLLGTSANSVASLLGALVTEIETARLLLRPWRIGDLDPYARICADPEVIRRRPLLGGWVDRLRVVPDFTAGR